MANTITVVPGTGIGSSLGNIFLTVLAIVASVAVILWIVSMIPGANKYVPFAQPQA